jgi:hypothetical protein
MTLVNIMLKSSNKTLVKMESPWLWFLLVIPVTIAIMVYQYPEHATNHHHGTVISQPTDKHFAAMRPASPAASGQATASRDGSGATRALQMHAIPTVITTGSAPLSADHQQTPAVDRRRTDSESTPVQGSSISVAGNVNPGGEEGGAGPSVELSSNEPAGPPINADLVSILEENPYLPVADEEYVEPMLADGSTSSPCPEVLFRGGNDYVMLRLAQMGCEIPGG